MSVLWVHIRATQTLIASILLVPIPASVEVDRICREWQVLCTWYVCTIESTRRCALSDIKPRRKLSVLYLINQDYKCFKWLKKDLCL